MYRYIRIDIHHPHATNTIATAREGRAAAAGAAGERGEARQGADGGDQARAGAEPGHAGGGFSVYVCSSYVVHPYVADPEGLTSHPYAYHRTAPPQWAEEQLEGLQAALGGKLEERAKEAGDRLDVLQRRVDTLEEVG